MKPVPDADATGWTVDPDGLLVPPNGGTPMSSTWVADALDVPSDDGYALVQMVAQVVALRSALYDAITSVLDDPRVFGVTLDHETGMASLVGGGDS